MLKIKTVVPSDVPLILSFIKELAAYENRLAEVTATEGDIYTALFDHHRAEAVIAYVQDQPVGFAIFYHTFASYTGKTGMYLEDIFVQPEFRGKGYGKTLLSYVANLTQTRNCIRLEWSAQINNIPAIQFYLSLGAKQKSDSTRFRLVGDALKKLATAEELSLC